VSVVVFPVQSVAEEAEMVVVRAAVGWLTVAATVLVQPGPSLIVTVYVPGGKPVAVTVFCTGLVVQV